jgi:hypothetical protein
VFESNFFYNKTRFKCKNIYNLTGFWLQYAIYLGLKIDWQWIDYKMIGGGEMNT